MSLLHFLTSLGIDAEATVQEGKSTIQSLVMDDNVLVDITQQGDKLFFISLAPPLSDQHYLANEQTKKALAWSLTREPGQTCLAKDSNHLLVQTVMMAESTSEELKEGLNGHCRFIDKLNQLTLSSEAKAYQHDVILP